MAELGFLTSKQEKALAEMIDEALHLKGFLELIDGYAAKIVITLIDDKLLEKLAVKVSADIKAQIGALVDAAIAKDLPLAETLASALLTSVVNIPGLDKETEGLILKGAIELLVGALIDWLKPKPAPAPTPAA
jgi:hypothetical protein